MHSPKHQAPHEILNTFFLRKKSKNSAYSLRALARDLGKSPAFVSQILSGKSKASADVLEKLAEILELDGMARSQLGASLVMHSSLPAAAKDNFKNLRTAGQAEHSNYQESNYIEFDTLKHWYYIAILDLCSLQGFRSEIPWIAKTLGISRYQAETAIQELLQKGLLNESDGQWRKSTFKLRLSTNSSREVVRAYHRQVIEKSLVELREKTDLESFKKRLITGMTLAVNPVQLERAKARLEEALFEASQILTEGECTELYQLNLQMFMLATTRENQ